MQVIPVIDLKGKQVVHAKMGQRHLYAPIATPLAAGSAPGDVIRGFLSVAAFKTVYAADLDAIEGKDGHEDVIADLQSRFPGVTFWVDAGVKSVAEAHAWLACNGADLVVGSESFQDAEAFAALREEPRIILSLDFRGDVFQGPPRLLDDAGLWPRRLIVMTLARVGSDAGPDFRRVEAIVKRAGLRAAYAAGGLRSADDLRRLRDFGAAGALIASALHDGRLGAADLAALGKLK